MRRRSVLFLLLAAPALPGCGFGFPQAVGESCDNLCTLCCRSSSGSSSGRIGMQDIDGAIVRGSTECHRVVHPKAPHHGAIVATMVFREGEFIVRFALRTVSQSGHELNMVASHPIPAGGDGDVVVLSAEIVEPKGAPAITGGKLRIHRWVYHSRFEGSFDLELADGSRVTAAFMVKYRHHLSDPEFRGGGGGGD